ncbi:protein GLUTAMINE DUMPER 2-like [Vitis riparia]|uniref:protein GLUTAMINE DUMPER 2-like n=1 Tax=Vitis riparia TaxID=96939 RepID=UPI00155AF366|nr:protein GLUTAMINE DUMPER 2-like [Vitis riparia]
MRTGAPFNATAASPATVQRSPWHSPVPYLFGGLAAMLGLIAFALLILACSYWRFSNGHLDNGESGGERDLESGDDGKGGDSRKVGPVVYEEKIVVIMAGDEKPRFLATPMSSRASSFGDNNGKSDGEEKKEQDKAEKSGEKLKEDMNHYEQTTTSHNGETQHTHEAQEQNQ